jgi:hypothetical protein
MILLTYLRKGTRALNKKFATSPSNHHDKR